MYNFCRRVVRSRMLLPGRIDALLVVFREQPISAEIEHCFDFSELVTSYSHLHFSNDFLPSGHILEQDIDSEFIARFDFRAGIAFISQRMKTSPLVDHPD